MHAMTFYLSTIGALFMLSSGDWGYFACMVGAICLQLAINKAARHG